MKPKRITGILLGIVAGFCLSNCALLEPEDRIQVERLNNHYFPSKEHSSEVAILSETPKDRFVPLARIRARGEPGSSMTILLEEIQAKAAELGADAIVKVQTGWRLATGAGFNPAMKQDYGYPSPPNNEAYLGATAKQIPWVVGLAIKYEKGEQKP